MFFFGVTGEFGGARVPSTGVLGLLGAGDGVLDLDGAGGGFGGMIDGCEDRM